MSKKNVGFTKPNVPGNSGSSWFLGIKCKQKPPDNVLNIDFKGGSGVPINLSMPNYLGHGYWIYRSMGPYNGKPRNGQAFFYYTGTGPRYRSSYGEVMPYVLWVKNTDADVSKTLSSNQARDPSKDQASHLKLSAGVGPGFFIQRGGNSGSREGSRPNSGYSSAVSSRESSPARPKSGYSTPNQGYAGSSLSDFDRLFEDAMRRYGLAPKGEQKQKKQKPVVEQASKSYFKRSVTRGSRIVSLFGKRKPDGPNFGTGSLLEKGSDDPDFVPAMYPVPSQHAMLYGGKVTMREGQNGLIIGYYFESWFYNTHPQFNKVKEVYMRNLGMESVQSVKPKSKGAGSKGTQRQKNEVQLAPDSSVIIDYDKLKPEADSTKV
uniref:Nucleoprotein n=1 Tax=Guangdong chinese water skink coronavirus TaxID=2116470 RepID=A0A2P1GNQ4_9NIDO|nr:nucleoprotein [Guangdong chinese water skink coronavirus]